LGGYYGNVLEDNLSKGVRGSFLATTTFPKGKRISMGLQEKELLRSIRKEIKEKY